MNKNFVSILKITFLSILFGSIVITADRIYFEPARYKDMAQTIHEEIKKEVYDDLHAQLITQIQSPEVTSLIREEVQNEVTQLMAGQIQTKDNLVLNSSENQKLPENLKEIIHEMIMEIVANENIGNIGLTDKELAGYTAGTGIEPNVRIEKGLQKSATGSPMQLAQNTSGGASSRTQSDSSDKPAGSPVERTESLERTLQQRGSILLPKGTLQVEPSFTYAHFSSNRINIQGFSILPVLVVGDISVDEVNRDVFIQTTSLKYGLMDNFQTELKIPFRAEYDLITNSATSESDRSAAGLGDIEFGISRQIGWEHGIMPDLIASFGVKTPSGKDPYNRDIALGTGHWAIRGALIAAKASDPAVIFSSLNYTYNFERTDIDNFGDIKPGDSVGYSVGTAIALSYQVAINFSFDQSISFRMQRNGRDVTDSFLNTMNFKTGLTWAMDENKSLDFGVSMGLTKDSPDATVELRVPITF